MKNYFMIMWSLNKWWYIIIPLMVISHATFSFIVLLQFGIDPAIQAASIPYLAVGIYIMLKWLLVALGMYLAWINDEVQDEIMRQEYIQDWQKDQRESDVDD